MAFMEMILGVIEDALERYEGGSGDDKADAMNELKLNFNQFKTQLNDLANGGNADAKGILDRLLKTGLG
jgi:hypothetical protein